MDKFIYFVIIALMTLGVGACIVLLVGCTIHEVRTWSRKKESEHSNVFNYGVGILDQTGYLKIVISKHTREYEADVLKWTLERNMTSAMFITYVIVALDSKDEVIRYWKNSKLDLVNKIYEL